MIAVAMSAFVSKGDDFDLLPAAIHGADVMPTESDYRFLLHHRATGMLRRSEPRALGLAGRRSAGGSAALVNPG